MTFPLEQDGRRVHAVPGSRRWAVALDDVLARVRTLVASIDRRVFMPLPAEPDDDPILGPMLSACGPRLHVPGQLAILPPSRRFNRGDRRVFAAKTWLSGFWGYVLEPSDFRPGLAIWAFSDNGLLACEEYATLERTNRRKLWDLRRNAGSGSFKMNICRACALSSKNW